LLARVGSANVSGSSRGQLSGARGATRLLLLSRAVSGASLRRCAHQLRSGRRAGGFDHRDARARRAVRAAEADSGSNSADREQQAIGGVVVTLLWFYVSSLAILAGAELSAEIEHGSPYGKDPGEKGKREEKAWRRRRACVAARQARGHANPATSRTN